MMLHKSANGEWRRCVATTRPGFGVSDCPMFKESKPGEEVEHLEMETLAARGGGTISRWTENGTRISTVSKVENGVFTVSTDKRTYTYNADGTPAPKRKRTERKAERLAAENAALKAMRDELEAHKRVKRITQEVKEGLAAWGRPEGQPWREKVMSYAHGAENQLYTEDAVATLMVVASQPQTPKELAPALAAFRADITSEPDALTFLTQRVRSTREASAA